MATPVASWSRGALRSTKVTEAQTLTSAVAGKRKRAIEADSQRRKVARAGSAQCLETSDEPYGRVCSHWLHTLPHVYLAKTAVRHLDECSNIAPTGRWQSSSLKDTLDLKRFARTGGIDLSDLRGYKQPDMAPPDQSWAPMLDENGSQPSLRSQWRAQPVQPTATTQSSGPYDANFRQLLVANGIYPVGSNLSDRSQQPEPNNLSSIQTMLRQRRRSLSPSRFSNGEFQAFKIAQADISTVTSETAVRGRVMTQMLGSRDATGVAENPLLANLSDLIPQTTRLRPDLYLGALVVELEQKVLDDLGAHIQPCPDTPLPVAPNFFVELKSSNGSEEVAMKQCATYGAMGARGMHELRQYGTQDSHYDENAYTITCTYAAGALRLYSHHVGPPRPRKLQPTYYMQPLDSYWLNATYHKAVEGLTAFRNAADWADQQRRTLIDRANEIALSHQHEVPRENHNESLPVEGSGSQRSEDEYAQESAEHIQSHLQSHDLTDSTYPSDWSPPVGPRPTEALPAASNAASKAAKSSPTMLKLAASRSAKASRASMRSTAPKRTASRPVTQSPSTSKRVVPQRAASKRAASRSAVSKLVASRRAGASATRPKPVAAERPVEELEITLAPVKRTKR